MAGESITVECRNFHPRRRLGARLKERRMGRYLLLWLIGVPIPILVLIWLLGGLH
jgi:hypothetical protein